jgi:hypothetical protein
MASRDMTKQQFDEAIKRNGFEPQGFMNYYKLPIPGHHFSVSALNGGNRRRDQLAYLLEQLEIQTKKLLG